MADAAALRPQLFAGVSTAHWAYEHVEAVKAGDSRFLSSVLPSAEVHLVTEPLDGSGVCLLHLAALFNKPEVLCHMLDCGSAAIDAETEARKVTVRHAHVLRGSRDADELDRIDRLRVIAHERAYLTMLGCRDSTGRSVLHYAAASRGACLPRALEHDASRFAAARSELSGHVPLFPDFAAVSLSSGALLPARGGSADVISTALLLRSRNDPELIDARDSLGGTPLHYATIAGDVRAVRVLMAAGADGFAQTLAGSDPLALACTRAVRAALVPLEHAVRTACGSGGSRAGMRAPVAGIVSALCQSGGAGVGQAAARSPSAARGSPGGARLMLASPGPQSSGTPSSPTRAHAALSLLVNSGEDINKRTGIHLRAPLHHAAESASLDVASLLLKSGASVDVVDVNGCTPLHLCAELGSPGHQALVSLLVEAGAAVCPTNTARKTPLHLAATGGPRWSPSSSGAATGLASGAATGGGGGVDDDDDAGDEFSVASPEANTDGGSAMVTLLVRLGAGTEAADTHGNTPLICAAKRGNFRAVDTLLRLGARPYAANVRGHTALHVSAFAHQLPVVRQLVRWDAEIGLLKETLDTSGRSAYDLAADPPTRDAMHTLFETAAAGRLDLVQVLLSRRPAASSADASGGEEAAPWAQPSVTDVTRVLRRSALHCVVTGAARAVSKAAAAAAAEAKGHPTIARRGAIAPLRPARAAVNASAVHIVAGVGLRFVPRPLSVGLPHPLRAQWGGDPIADLKHGFPSLPGDGVSPLLVDPTAYLVTRAMQMQLPAATAAGPRPGSGGGAVSSLAAARLQPGSELVSPAPEKTGGRVLDWLLRMGVPADAPDVDGVTPLHLAARYGTLFLLRRLLEAGAAPEAVDHAANTPLHYAHAFGQALAAQMLEAAAAGTPALEARNAVGRTPDEVAGTGVGLLGPHSAELRELRVSQPSVRSAGLVVSAAH